MTKMSFDVVEYAKGKPQAYCVQFCEPSLVVYRKARTRTIKRQSLGNHGPYLLYSGMINPLTHLALLWLYHRCPSVEKTIILRPHSGLSLGKVHDEQQTELYRS
jgi:hypothetical protein